MTNAINSSVARTPIPLTFRTGETEASTQPEGSSAFQSLLFDSLAQTESMQQAAQGALEKGLAGGDITQVEIMTSMKKADLALRMMIQVRNKIFDAYDEIKQLRM